MELLIFFLALTTVVAIHEAGHAFFAKMFGVVVEEFSIGFGSVIYKVEWKGTLYKLSILPLGGYVQLKTTRKLEDIKIPEFVNRYIEDDDGNLVIDISEYDSDIHMPDAGSIESIPAWKQFIVNAGGIIFNIVSLYLVVIPYMIFVQDKPFMDALIYCVSATILIPVFMWVVLQNIFSKNVVDTFAGPVEGSTMIHQKTIEMLHSTSPFVEFGFTYVLMTASVLIFNLLPIPPLDGWNMSMNTYEMITGRRVNKTFNLIAKLVGVVLMIILFILSYGKDVYKAIF